MDLHGLLELLEQYYYKIYQFRRDVYKKIEAILKLQGEHRKDDNVKKDDKILCK